MPIILQILFFVITHIPELIKVARAIADFIRHNRRNPKFKSWVAEFSEVATIAKEKKDPRPLEEFFSKIRAEVHRG